MFQSALETLHCIKTYKTPIHLRICEFELLLTKVAVSKLQSPSLMLHKVIKTHYQTDNFAKPCNISDYLFLKALKNIQWLRETIIVLCLWSGFP